MSQTKKFDEQEFTGASYLITFYQQVGLLTTSTSQYQNLLLELQEEVADLEKLPEEKKEPIKNAIRTVRQQLTVTNIQYETIKENLKAKQEETKEATKIYKKLKKDYIIDRDKLERYCLLLNKFLVRESLQKLMTNASELINEIYSK